MTADRRPPDKVRGQRPVGVTSRGVIERLKRIEAELAWQREAEQERRDRRHYMGPG